MQFTTSDFIKAINRFECWRKEHIVYIYSSKNNLDKIRNYLPKNFVYQLQEVPESWLPEDKIYLIPGKELEFYLEEI